MATFSMENVRAVCKHRDAWWTVLLVDPIAVRLTWLVANRTSITPNQITLAAFALGTGAAGCFAQASAGWLALGALLYHLGFVLDCVDGKIARLRGTGSPFGGWLDFMLDRIRDALCAVALTGGQFLATGQAAFLWLGFAILALDMIRYLNGPQIAKARRKMTDEAAGGEDDDAPAESAEPSGGRCGRPSRYLRVRRALLRRRVRMHLISGIEFQMAAFIVGPLTGAILPVTVAAGLMLAVFELLIIYRFWRASRTYACSMTAGTAPRTSAPSPAVVPGTTEVPRQRRPLIDVER
ncbi:CDP-alcohol phosphatidyltransferase family protein [Spirillospora sp. NPDC048911]|uniref:CDP-alcohol phosphatidyltransferase family protein n=1 Tax=Spirillospora sp. NPDC048911 TaxID=3364527 RepID=UPI00371912DF